LYGVPQPLTVPHPEVRMRTWSAVFMAVFLPAAIHAQAFQFRSPAPEVTAAAAPWQVSSQPIVVQGLVYLPTRDYRPFDGQVMTQVGVYQGVPVYADTTLEVYSLVYVPVGVQRMRMYERVRDRELAGTTGSRAPTFPVRSPSVPVGEDRLVGTAGTTVPSAVGPMQIAATPQSVLPTGTTIESIPRPTGTNGIWLYFNGFYAAGVAVPFSADRFTLVGQHEGFPVYRDMDGKPGEIWVAVINGGRGPVAPYLREAR
jgi:hypothetical protein